MSYRGNVRHCSAIYTMALCPSVCVRMSQVGVLSIRRDESSWVLARRLPSPLSYAVLQRNSGIFKIRVGLVLSGTLSQILGLFRHGKSIACQQNSSTVELVDHTYHGRRIVDVYYTSVDCNGPFIHMLRVAALVKRFYQHGAATRRRIRANGT